jgi:hypothetical protein
MPLVHLDTDIGGDIDDLCALAMLLRWPGVARSLSSSMSLHAQLQKPLCSAR